MFRRLPLPLVLALLAVHVVAFQLVAYAATEASCAFSLPTVGAAGILAFGATAALCGRTWGIGLVLAAAVSFLAAGAQHLGPWSFYVAGAIGTLPFLLTAKHMARFHLGATVLFALLAALGGTSASLFLAR